MLIFLTNFVSSFSYKEKNRQIDNKIFYEIFLDDKIFDKGIKEMIETKEGYIFLDKVYFEEDYENVEISLILDYGYLLSEVGASPIDYETFTDGRLIEIKWKFDNIRKGDQKTFFAIIEKYKEKKGGLIYVISIISLVLIFLSIFLFFTKKKKENNIYLLEEEKKIVNYLKKCDRNESWQKNIQKDLGFSKAKLSRLIRNLESRNLIKKIPFGNTNKIILK